MEELTPIRVEDPDNGVNDVTRFIACAIESVGIAHSMHLNTSDYEKHKALDEYYKDMPELIDEFAETYRGMYPESTIPFQELQLFNSPLEMIGFLHEKADLIHKTLPPCCTNPLEDIMTKFMQISYKLRMY